MMKMSPNNVPADVRKEVEQAFGFVPTFFQGLTPDAMRLWWTSMRDFELSEKTALDGKTKELIGLGVASQIPCHYCVIFHTEAARLNGASDAEIQESIFMASLTRQGSTILNGILPEHATFEKEVKQIVSFVQKQGQRTGQVSVPR